MKVAEAGRRKRLGQFFSGVPLARVLAALADAAHAGTIIDPMGGDGDMLEACVLEGAAPDTLAAIEIDDDAATACRLRMSRLGVRADIVRGNAFERDAWPRSGQAWDLVITNPPYVRYQTGGRSARGGIPGATEVRAALQRHVATAPWLDADDRDAFTAYAASYSGLADLAVPAWLLCAAGLRVGGRLAIVAPATWLTREYAAPVLHFLRRYFQIEYVVEDADGAWFPEALVRSTLLVAKRVEDKGDAFVPGGHLRIRLTSESGNDRGLVGRAFPTARRPEAEFASWARALYRARRGGTVGAIRASWSNEADLRRHLSASAEHLGGLVETGSREAQELIPERMAELLGPQAGLVSLDDLGWRAAQGLRTGANDFFYVTEADGGVVSAVLPGETLQLPPDVLRDAVRRQTELPPDSLAPMNTPSKVLVLEQWALPEDIAEANGPRLWRPMNDCLARLVRAAAEHTLRGAELGTPLPALSAVRTNVRGYTPQRPSIPARFWYQLPQLQRRHRPALFVPRVNAGSPITRLNPRSTLVIDANFSTLWPEREAVSPLAMLALLNSTWVRSFLELTGTVLGAGALKVEAAHLRRLRMPRVNDGTIERLHGLGTELAAGGRSAEVIADIDSAVLGRRGRSVSHADGLRSLLASLQSERTLSKTRSVA